jgi:hypothetical protein
METRHSSTSSISRSRSPISDNEKRSISPPPKRGPSTPIKSSIPRNDSDEEGNVKSDDHSKEIMDETSSPLMSDTEESHQKKRSHHRHHHHRHHKQSKSNKRSATHHQHSVKRRYFKKENIFQ